MNNKEKFVLYKTLLREWTGRMNLVAPSTLQDIDVRHIEDSAQLADFLPNGVLVADMGSGAGFPGVVLAILGWDVICIESTGKKVSFLKTLKAELDLPNLTIFHDRLENFITKERANKRAIVFTARAFAPLTKILDYTYPMKNRLFLLKGREIGNEILDAKKKYSFDYDLHPSKTGDGFIVRIWDIKLFHVK